MGDELRIVYVSHSLRSDWNNGNAHFLRGLLRAMMADGHQLTALELETGWSIDHLRLEERGARSLAEFERIYPELKPSTYSEDADDAAWSRWLGAADVVVLHEWNPPTLAHRLLRMRDRFGYKLLFHDTHHRASSSPAQIALFGLDRFDGVIAFGEALRTIYRQRFSLRRVWTLHEAADTTVFKPVAAEREDDVIWIGNWGEGERAEELRSFFVRPSASLTGGRVRVYGVRYPPAGLESLRDAGIAYGGYLPNLDAPAAYGRARLTVHVPRQQYSSAMTGIPTIRVFEALACGIPLISAPWQDTEELFRAGDFRMVASEQEMADAMHDLLDDAAGAAEQARRGLETALARHTCAHRALELTRICREVVG